MNNLWYCVLSAARHRSSWGLGGAVSPPSKKSKIKHFKRHSEAYAHSICMHDLTTFVSLIYEI